MFLAAPSVGELAQRGIVIGSARETSFVRGRVSYFRQGANSKGQPIPTEISDPSTVVMENPPSTAFCALGVGGEIVVEFQDGFADGPGSDVSVTERSWGESPMEQARVYYSADGRTWTLLGLADNAAAGSHNADTVTGFDLGAKTETAARFIKLVDETKPRGVAEQNGFDVASIRVAFPASRVAQ